MWYYGRFPEYVPVAKRRANAAKFAKAEEKRSGRKFAPVVIEGRKIARTFWGEAWCDNLESYSDFENRLPRGRAYARNGSVIDLSIGPGKIEALVSGSEIYKVEVTIRALPPKAWRALCDDCSREIDSLIDLLAGKFSKGVMRRLCRQEDGLFPRPKEIEFACSCPDGAWMCKHVAAVLYGVGARLDATPELLFQLREVKHAELVARAVDRGNLDQALDGAAANSLAGADLGAMFGIELDSAADSAPAPSKRSARAKPAAKASGSAKASRAAKVKKVSQVVAPVAAPAPENAIASSPVAAPLAAAPPVAASAQVRLVKAPGGVARNFETLRQAIIERAKQDAAQAAAASSARPAGKARRSKKPT